MSSAYTHRRNVATEVKRRGKNENERDFEQDKEIGRCRERSEGGIEDEEKKASPLFIFIYSPGKIPGSARGLVAGCPGGTLSRCGSA